MPDVTCSVATCNRPTVARGWCDMHYRRWRRDGDPLREAKIRGRFRREPTCKQGHAWTDESTGRRTGGRNDGTRFCRICARASGPGGGERPPRPGPRGKNASGTAFTRAPSLAVGSGAGRSTTCGAATAASSPQRANRAEPTSFRTSWQRAPYPKGLFWITCAASRRA